jgi:hypothetical protein
MHVIELVFVVTLGIIIRIVFAHIYFRSKLEVDLQDRAGYHETDAAAGIRTRVIGSGSRSPNQTRLRPRI